MSILPSEQIKTVREDCLVVPKEMSYVGEGIISYVYTVKPGIYKAAVETKAGVFYAGEGYPLSKDEMKKSWNSLTFLHGGGFHIPHKNPELAEIFSYETMVLLQTPGELLNLGGSKNSPVGAKNVNFSEGPNGYLGNKITGGLANALRPPDGTILIWSRQPTLEFRKAVSLMKASGEACRYHGKAL